MLLLLHLRLRCRDGGTGAGGAGAGGRGARGGGGGGGRCAGPAALIVADGRALGGGLLVLLFFTVTVTVRIHPWNP